MLQNHTVKVNTIKMNKKIDVPSREIEIFIKKNQVETSDLKNIIHDMKDSLGGLNSRMVMT